MERESFEDKEVADLLNENFISIKVDREERPDVDNIYMTFCQALTGHGGWPLTIIMTPEQKPFYAGTYFPKTGRMGIPGLTDVLDRVIEAWGNNRNDLISSSEKITENIMEHFAIGGKKQEVSSDIMHKAYRTLSISFDPDYGGFSPAPKFPTPHNLSFLLRYYKKNGEQKALDMVTKTLDSMYRGGIFDHIGFGFSRYSTDRKWLVPHFEKMLYDNALLAIAYLEAYQVTKDKLYADIARKIFTYVLRDMVSPEGGFYSAEDADSEGVEGKFYVWEPNEAKEILGNEDGERFCSYYGITSNGNFEGNSIPNRIHADGVNEGEEDIIPLREKIFNQRDKRIHPYKDDKILTSWNGLMIAAMAIGGRVLDNKSYINAAENAAKFILNNLTREDDRLLARYRDGETAYLAYIDDYAFFVWGLIELYQTTYNAKHLEYAIKINNDMIKYFWDTENGGFFIYGKDSEKLIAQPKEIYDGATPSGNSVALNNIIRLARITGDESLEKLANEQIKTFGEEISRTPHGYTHFLTGIMFTLESTFEIVITGDIEKADTKNMLETVRKNFLPNAVIIFVPDGQDREALTAMLPYIKDYKPVNDRATAYVCKNFSCQAPTNDIDELGLI